MDFTGIGKIGAFAKQKNLIYAANYRIKTGQRLTDGNGNLNFSSATIFSQTSKTESTSSSDKARLASIKQKLKSGKKLSAAEMSYLREKDEKLYKKAKYADEAREELKADLRNAKTKQEAQQAVMRATAKIAADCSADFEALKGGGGGGISFGGNTNIGGDISANMNGGGEVANFAGSENFSTSNTETSTNENSFAQVSNSENENSDGAFDILDKYIYAIRAIQDEWLEFIKTDNYKDLPQDIFEKNEIKISNMQLVDALFAYKKSMALKG